MVRIFFGMSKLLFAVLLFFCLSVAALATTTKPQVQQKNDACKDLREVSTCTIEQHFTQLVVTWVTTLKKTCFRIESKIFREYEDSGTQIRTRRFQKFTPASPSLILGSFSFPQVEVNSIFAILKNF